MAPAMPLLWVGSMPAQFESPGIEWSTIVQGLQQEIGWAAAAFRHRCAVWR